jgi:aspartyl aminopeptidase
MVASGDMAHATHPDYPERHEPAHPIFVNAGIPTVDVGAPQLAMHSARELMGAADVGSYAAALAAFLAPE